VYGHIAEALGGGTWAYIWVSGHYFGLGLAAAVVVVDSLMVGHMCALVTAIFYCDPKAYT